MLCYLYNILWLHVNFIRWERGRNVSLLMLKVADPRPNPNKPYINGSVFILTSWTVQWVTRLAWTPATPGRSLQCCSQHSGRSRLGWADMAERKTDWCSACWRLSTPRSETHTHTHQSFTAAETHTLSHTHISHLLQANNKSFQIYST